jgi:hypothetical protein
VFKSIQRTTPEDAAHRWRRNVEQFSQKLITRIKVEEQNL